MNREVRKYCDDFIESACYRIDESLDKIEKCLDRISQEDLWKRPNAVSNSIGNQLLHLVGNMTQYGVTSLLGTRDSRDRDSEFQATEGKGKAALLEDLKATAEMVKQSMKMVPVEELLRVRRVQSYELSGIGSILHVVEHLSYHTGQIVFWTKILIEKPMGFYDGIDLNSKNN